MSSAAIENMQASPQDEAAAELDRLVRVIASQEAIVDGWDAAQAATVQALKSAIEALHKEALRRLIRTLKDDPAALPRLREAVADPIVRGVLQFHGLLRERMETRLERALDDVRPSMHLHGGDVELVRVVQPDAVEIRLTGACHGCPASSETLREGVERAIRAHCPEIVHIRQVSRGPVRQAGDATHFISPFAANTDQGWVDAARLDEIPEGGIIERRIAGRSVLLSQRAGRVSCFDNACAHLGMPLEMGDIADGVITCTYHGFRYLLETGECLTAPEVQLVVHAARVRGDRVAVRLEG
ncbi:MAG TPA: NifU family protein [Acetobacteraceae bacterium]|nr:NifU family protein [Acetobacteraceae bacterium]